MQFSSIKMAGGTRGGKIHSVPLCSILVVDDNYPAADALVRLLALNGYAANVAYTGHDAIAVAHLFNPDVILLDIGLPDMSGYEVARMLRAQAFKKQIVALSGYGQMEDKEEALKAGCDGHITKPMSVVRLEEFLMSSPQYLQQKELED